MRPYRPLLQHHNRTVGAGVDEDDAGCPEQAPAHLTVGASDEPVTAHAMRSTPDLLTHHWSIPDADHVGDTRDRPGLAPGLRFAV